ncbi:hypothetical protein F4824DRAFT_454417 [Ustulina deusta]|nr:hypothetical protein F4824DRAFT_454417 [Ustulina deusta]
MRTRLKKVRLYYSGDETPKSVQLCTDESWRAIKSGEDFQQRVHVHIYSPSSLVTLQVDGILETDQLFLSNSPCQAQGLFVSKPSGTKQPRSQTMETIDQIGLLQQCLYPLTI